MDSYLLRRGHSLSKSTLQGDLRPRCRVISLFVLRRRRLRQALRTPLTSLSGSPKLPSNRPNLAPARPTNVAVNAAVPPCADYELDLELADRSRRGACLVSGVFLVAPEWQPLTRIWLASDQNTLLAIPLVSMRLSGKLRLRFLVTTRSVRVANSNLDCRPRARVNMPHSHSTFTTLMKN